MHRQLMHGDYLHLVITGPTGVPTNHIQLAACEREAADSQRYIYGPSPSPSPDRLTPVVEQDESNDEEDDDEVSVSLLQKTACVQRAQAIRTEHHPDKPVRTPLSEITNTLALDAPRAFPSASQPDMRSSSDFPHVNDRWCESHVELRVPDCPAAPRRISLSDSIPASPELLCRARIYNLYGTSCYNLTLVLLARFRSLSNGTLPLKWPLKTPQLG